MIREKVESIKLEEKDIIALNEICNINCKGVNCDNCDMFTADIAPVHSCYKHLTNMFLEQKGVRIGPDK